MNDIEAILSQLPKNPFGERVTVLGASKTRTAEEIVQAYGAGIPVMGENRVQEFREKYDAVHAAGIPYRFIGHLQTNKIKYLVNKVDMIESVDRDELIFALQEASEKAGTVTSVLLEINGGNEESKSGYTVEEIPAAAEKVLASKNLKLCGLMAMLPETENGELLRTICTAVRKAYDELKNKCKDLPQAAITTLSMGMSGDYETAISCGSNEIRLGRAIFGERNY